MAHSQNKWWSFKWNKFSSKKSSQRLFLQFPIPSLTGGHYAVAQGVLAAHIWRHSWRGCSVLRPDFRRELLGRGCRRGQCRNRHWSLWGFYDLEKGFLGQAAPTMWRGAGRALVTQKWVREAWEAGREGRRRAQIWHLFSTCQECGRRALSLNGHKKFLGAEALLFPFYRGGNWSFRCSMDLCPLTTTLQSWGSGSLTHSYLGPLL